MLNFSFVNLKKSNVKLIMDELVNKKTKYFQNISLEKYATSE